MCKFLKMMAETEMMGDGNLAGPETPVVDRGANLHASTGVLQQGSQLEPERFHSFRLFALSHIDFSRTFLKSLRPRQLI